MKLLAICNYANLYHSINNRNYIFINIYIYYTFIESHFKIAYIYNNRDFFILK